MTKIFINADDFGLNSSVNKAIVQSFKSGIINSATLMANMPGFDEAVEHISRHNLSSQIGVHLVLTEGNPLTEEIKLKNYFFNGYSEFKENRYLFFLLNKRNKKLIYNEFAAQIEKVMSEDIHITHLDTHHHVHELYGITKILLKLRKTYNIPSIRILNNLEKSTSFYKRWYRKLVNIYIKRKRANFSELFGNRDDFLVNVKLNPTLISKKKVEIMVHPSYNSAGKLIDIVGTDELDFNFVKTLKLINK